MINPRPRKKLVISQKSVEMVARMYEVTRDFPREEAFGLKAQLRRAAVSVPSNIAEGLTRKTRKDKVRFLNIADSSLSEIDTQLEISRKLEMIRPEVFEGAEIVLMDV